MILKKGWLFNLEILEIYGQVNSEEHTQRELNEQIKKQNIENHWIKKHINIKTKRYDKCRIN